MPRPGDTRRGYALDVRSWLLPVCTPSRFCTERFGNCEVHSLDAYGRCCELSPRKRITILDAPGEELVGGDPSVVEESLGAVVRKHHCITAPKEAKLLREPHLGKKS